MQFTYPTLIPSFQRNKYAAKLTGKKQFNKIKQVSGVLETCLTTVVKINQLKINHGF